MKSNCLKNYHWIFPLSKSPFKKSIAFFKKFLTIIRPAVPKRKVFWSAAAQCLQTWNLLYSINPQKWKLNSAKYRSNLAEFQYFGDPRRAVNFYKGFDVINFRISVTADYFNFEAAKKASSFPINSTPKSKKGFVLSDNCLRCWNFL